MYENIGFIHQNLVSYRKINKYLEEKIGKHHILHRRISLHEKVAQESWLAVLLTKKKLKNLKKENQNRQKLAKLEFQIQLFPGGPIAPALPREAQGNEPASSGHVRFPSEAEGWAMRALDRG